MRIFGTKFILVTVIVLFHVCAVEATNYGKFHGEFVVKPQPDGRSMVLVESLTYIDAKGLKWLVPKGTKTDGASIPKFAQALFPPFSGKYRIAAVVHDRYCQTRDRTWEAVHSMFYEAMLAARVDVVTALTLYAAVYTFGPRWSIFRGPNRGASIKTKLSDADQEIAFHDLKAWIEKENPTPKDIEKRVNSLRIRELGTKKVN